MRGKALVIFAVTLFMVSGAWAGTETVLYNFASLTGGTDGEQPYGTLVADKAGHLYGTTLYGGTNSVGTVFELSQSGGAWTETVLHSFIGGTSDGAYPYGGVVFDAAGNIYGTTNQGGTSNIGTVYELKKSGSKWTESIIHDFTGYPKDGTYPSAITLFFDTSGNLFGTTYQGGAHNYGSVFKMTPSGGKWKYGQIHSFAAGNDGANPVGGVVMDKSGNVYGTTLYGGGNYNAGAIYQLFQARGIWVGKVIFSFTGGLQGFNPESGLIMDASGNLYGTAKTGGIEDYGMVYKLVPGSPWTQVSLYSFKAGSTDGEYTAYGNLAMDAKGNIYGTTTNGGPNNWGGVYKLTKSSKGYHESELYMFAASGDGCTPESNVILVGTKIYGANQTCGGHGQGTAFEITP